MDSQQRPIGVDLFAGAGGMTLGFEQAGFDVLAAVELDPIHCATHEFNFPHTAILCRSIEDITGEEIRKHSKIGDRQIDVVFGGPPCQGFSIIGKRSLNDSRNALVFHFVRLVLELKPLFFVMENVPGLAFKKNQKLLYETIELFYSNGYEVEENYRVLNAANYGVPQDRSRLFLLGTRKGLSLPKYPQPITKPIRAESRPVSTTAEKLGCGFASPNIFQDGVPPVGGELFKTNVIRNAFTSSDLPGCPTVWDAIADLPEVESYPELLTRDWVVAPFGKPSNYSSQLRCLYPQVDDYSCDRLFDRSILTSSTLR